MDTLLRRLGMRKTSFILLIILIRLSASIMPMLWE